MLGEFNVDPRGKDCVVIRPSNAESLLILHEPSIYLSQIETLSTAQPQSLPLNYFLSFIFSFTFLYLTFNYPYLSFTYPYLSFTYPYLPFNYPYLPFTYPYLQFTYPYLSFNYPYLSFI